MSKKYLISISIGPVQDFIASARRSRDLWFGSWLLSELSKVVAKEIGKVNLIFPSIQDDKQLEENSNFNVVNKILAIVEIPNPTQFDKNLRDKIKDRLRRIYEDNGTDKGIFDEIDRKLGKDKSLFYRDEAKAQIEDLTELYWAAVPFDESKYVECRNRVETLLSARKATRDFAKVTWGSEAPKSSIDGQRESVILDSEIDKPHIQKIFNLRNKERLCGVGVMKRLTEKRSFASTSHIASLPLLDSLKDKKIDNFDYLRDLSNIIGKIDANELKNFVGKTPISHPFFENYDGHLLFENRLKDFFDEPKLTQAKGALKQFMENAFGKKDKKPNPYFALLQADGDRMGKVIDNQKNKDDHKELSKALSKFAGEVKTIVENHQGSLIYAGGDDVLAMLPLHTVLHCARELAEKFNYALSQNEKFKDTDGNFPTLSAGIAIVHHTEPLQESLETMRKAEKEAKKVKGKNALAIILSKRSGADTTIKGSWDDDRNSGKSFDERLKWFIYLHLAELFPSGAAHELRDLWIRFRDSSDSQGRIKSGFENLVKNEAFRIINRKNLSDGKTKVSDVVLLKLKNFIEHSSLSVQDLAKEIIVAKEFAKASKESGLSAEEFAVKNKLKEDEIRND
jgi:CRISPR-associated protein Cmr2